MNRLLNRWAKIAASFSFAMFAASGHSTEIETLDLDVIPYEEFIKEEPEAIEILAKALHEKGVVGIRGIPGYREKVERYIATLRTFCALPEEVKQSYAPDRSTGETVGYEVGAEWFKRPDGTWVIDDHKVSYYVFLPDASNNRWPVEIDLKTPCREIGMLMSQMGLAVMEKIGLTRDIDLSSTPRCGRMLYYRKAEGTQEDNPFWCGAHFDHGVFTALLPAYYFVNGQQVPEPAEAGLFIRTHLDGVFKKVVADDPEVMLFQVGEFGQILSNDSIRATEHRVHKAFGPVERYTMALFFETPGDLEVRSTSVLTSDARYGAGPGEPCLYSHWCEESYKRYLVQEK